MMKRLPTFALLASSFLCTAAHAAPSAMATTGVRSRFLGGPEIRQEARALRGNQAQLQRVVAEQAADAHVGAVLAHSQRNGNYYIVSDLHMGLGKAHPGGAFDRQEDFTRGDVWNRTLAHISRQPGNNTLVLGGDIIDILEHVNPEDGLAKVADAIGQMVRGHAADWKSLARAVVNDGLRVVYIRGNHDIRLLDSSDVAHGGAPVRQRFMDEVMKTADLTPAQQAVFKERVAFAGHAAPLGKFGEMLVFHGEQQDPTNSWRSPANPYSYTRDGRRIIPRTLGDNVVRDEWVSAETKNPDGENRESSPAKLVAHRILLDKSARHAAAKLLWTVSTQRTETGPAQELAERIDDRLTMQAWAQRTGFDKMLSSYAGTDVTPRGVAKRLEQAYARQPVPIQERMNSPIHMVNIATHLFGKNRLAKTPDAEPALLRDLAAQLPNVRYVVAGHDHAERIRIGTMADRGEVGFFDSGTWTKAGGEDRLDIVLAHTGHDGRIDTTPALFRINPANGKPEFPARAFEDRTKVEGWTYPAR